MAREKGLTDEETKSAFNKNMLDSGVLTDGPAGFGRLHNRRWLVTDYEAGDVVLHSTYMVGFPHWHTRDPELIFKKDPRFYYQPRPEQRYTPGHRSSFC